MISSLILLGIVNKKWYNVLGKTLMRISFRFIARKTEHILSFHVVHIKLWKENLVLLFTVDVLHLRHNQAAATSIVSTNFIFLICMRTLDLSFPDIAQLTVDHCSNINVFLNISLQTVTKLLFFFKSNLTLLDLSNVCIWIFTLLICSSADTCIMH